MTELKIKKIRNVYVVGYWKDTPWSYWGKTCWEPIRDFASRAAAKKYLIKTKKKPA